MDFARSVRFELKDFDPSWDGYIVFRAMGRHDIIEYENNVRRLEAIRKAAEELDQKESTDASRQGIRDASIAIVDSVYMMVQERFIEGMGNGEAIKKEDVQTMDYETIGEIARSITGLSKKK